MTCYQCKEDVEERLFATYRDRQGNLRRRGICLACRNQRQAESNPKRVGYRRAYNETNQGKKRLRDLARRAEIKEYVNKVKDVPCADCGCRWPPEAMDFDHVRGVKLKSIASYVSGAYRLELVKKEIEKCEVVCACCHRLRTHQRDEHAAGPRPTSTLDIPTDEPKTWLKRPKEMPNMASRLLLIDGVSLPMAVWADRLGVDPNVVHMRLKAGWDPRKAVFTPVRRYRRKVA